MDLVIFFTRGGCIPRPVRQKRVSENEMSKFFKSAGGKVHTSRHLVTTHRKFV